MFKQHIKLTQTTPMTIVKDMVQDVPLSGKDLPDEITYNKFYCRTNSEQCNHINIRNKHVNKPIIQCIGHDTKAKKKKQVLAKKIVGAYFYARNFSQERRSTNQKKDLARNHGLHQIGKLISNLILSFQNLVLRKQSQN